MSDELPAYMRDTVEKLSRGKHAAMLEVLLRKRAAAQTPDEQRRIDKLIVDLAKPFRAGWLALPLVTFMLGTLGYSVYRDHRHEETVKAGVPTVAQVKRLEEANCVLGTKESRCMALTLEVHPEKGAPYGAVLEHDVALEWMSRVQPGSWLTVAVDRADRQLVYFDEASMAVEAPKPPASGP